MYARIEFIPSAVPQEVVFNKIETEVLPILKRQKGFRKLLPFFPETAIQYGRLEKIIVISLWAEKRDAEQYEQETNPLVQRILKPLAMTDITTKTYIVESTASLFEELPAA
ncbi:MAG TPA: hypothetical protein VFA89_22770 [Terriglobales bacterium]|nr:hypothetical protein [Terriglobales bacterium]